MRCFILLLALLAPGVFAQPSGTSKVRSGSFVLLAEPRLPGVPAFVAQLQQRLQGKVVLEGVDADDGKVIIVRVPGGAVLVGLIDAPMPRDQAGDLCGAAWYWRTACEEIAPHKAQVFVSVVDTELDAVGVSLLQTQVIASLMDANTIASAWGASLQSRDAFLKMSADASRGEPPVLLWVGFRLASEADKGVSLSTQGMDAFGLHEIEAKDVNRPARDVFPLLAGMAQYLVARGPVIKDGETIGDSPSLDIRVTQGPSYWRPGRTVYRVEFPKAP